MSDVGRDYDHDRELDTGHCGVCGKRHEIGMCFPKPEPYRLGKKSQNSFKPPISWIVEEWLKEGRL